MPPTVKPGVYGVQVGAFREQENAERMRVADGREIRGGADRRAGGDCGGSWWARRRPRSAPMSFSSKFVEIPVRRKPSSSD